MKIDQELWKIVPGFDNYQVSTTGRVLSIRVNKTKILNPFICSHGYLSVELWNNKQCVKLLVHQIVAMAFLGHTPNKHRLVINHKDGNKLNNNVDNLEIVTNRENLTVLKHKKHSSKYSGVTWNRKACKWQAQISHSGKQNYLGVFKSEEQAKESYDKALQKILTTNIQP